MSHVRKARLKPVRKQVVGLRVRCVRGIIIAVRNSGEIKNYTNSAPRGIQKREGKEEKKKMYILCRAILPGNVVQMINLCFANCSGDHCLF